MRQPPTSSFLLLVAIGMAGCRPTCREVCDTLVACEGLDAARMTARECEESCLAQQDLLETWTDTELQRQFDDEMRCLGSSTCEDIAAGTCYQDDLWAF